MLSLFVILYRSIESLRILLVNYNTVTLVASGKEVFALVYRPIPTSTSTIIQSPERSDLEDTFNQPPERNDLEDTINKYPERNGLKTMNDEEVLTNISNIMDHSKKTYLEMVSSPPSTDDDDVSLSKLKPEIQQEVLVSNRHELDLIEKKNLHLSKISFGVSIIVKFSEMAGDTDSEMKPIPTDLINIDNYRQLVQTYLNLHAYNTALFWADKIVALTSGNPRDIYWLAQCMFLLKQFHRAAHLLRSQNLDKVSYRIFFKQLLLFFKLQSYVLCNYLTVRCLLEANELTEALKVINSMDMELFLQSNCNLSCSTSVDAGMFDETPKYQVQSSVLLLKGKVLEAMDNRGLASDCYKQALQCDVYCFEAFDALIQHHMLSATEEQDLLKSLPISHQCTTEEGQILYSLYKSKLKKYNTVVALVPHDDRFIFNNTPILHKISVNILETPTESKNVPEKETNTVERKEKIFNEPDSSIQARLENSLDLAVSQAELYYYNCDYVQCGKLTESILKKDPYHTSCLPIHISCQVELKQSNKLFTLAHNLVDLYPNLAISWFAVGCYYYIIGKRDSARRFLAKSTSLDRLFGPAWLAFGHSFAVESEHDQAMAAYFKASQLMKGCHLPLLYIGLECGLTNNVRLAEKFFQQAQIIAPEDPFVMHEMGVIAFHNSEYKGAEKHFQDALARIKPTKDAVIPERWEPLLNNLGHTCRKLEKYEEALEYHHQALVLNPQSASTYSAIGYVFALMNFTELAVHWFHKALGLRRDDTFSTTMLNYVIEQLSIEQPPYPDAPNYIPSYKFTAVTVEETAANESDITSEQQVSASDMSIEIDISEGTTYVKE
ncbi:hypothetical protein FQA39_LY13257 [Lamprigera yunnana]|nr:hypothetical protein FQA39_LY13257 [Lamprigera yunnana]